MSISAVHSLRCASRAQDPKFREATERQDARAAGRGAYLLSMRGISYVDRLPVNCQVRRNMARPSPHRCDDDNTEKELISLLERVFEKGLGRLDKVEKTLRELVVELGHKPKTGGRFNWALGPAKLKAPSKGTMIETTITNEQKVTATLAPVTAGGKPAKVDPKTPPTWAVQSGDSTVVPTADGLSADLISSDVAGDTVYSVSADADLGDGVETISDTITLHVTSPNATSLGLSLGAPVPK